MFYCNLAEKKVAAFEKDYDKALKYKDKDFRSTLHRSIALARSKMLSIETKY